MDAPIIPTLCQAFEGYLGKTLTPEVASQLIGEVAARCYPGPVDTSHIAPKVVGSYVIRCAPLKEALAKLRPLHEEHWFETEGYRHGLGFNPDYERVIDLDQQGRCLMVVVEHRETGELVGDYGFYLSVSAHTQTLMATEDQLFISKAHRRGRLGIELMKYAEYALTQLGVRDMNVSVKLVNNVGPMLERMGFTPTGKQYVKILEEPAHVLT